MEQFLNWVTNRIHVFNTLLLVLNSITENKCIVIALTLSLSALLADSCAKALDLD